jgi:hypothetical protein
MRKYRKKEEIRYKERKRKGECESKRVTIKGSEIYAYVSAPE